MRERDRDRGTLKGKRGRALKYRLIPSLGREEK